MTSSEPLRVVTWNIHHGRGLDGRVDLERIARVLEPLDADLLALQELDAGRARTGGVDQSAALAARLGMRAIFYEAFEDDDGGRYGHALLTRSAPTRTTLAPLPRWPLREPRGLIDARVDTRLGPVRAMSTHLGLLELERIRQARAIVGRVRDARHPVVLLGDLNAPSAVPSMRVLRRALADVTPRPSRERTWPAFCPLLRLDYVLASGLRGVRGRTVRGGEATVASDHLPLRAELAAVQ